MQSVMPTANEPKALAKLTGHLLADQVAKNKPVGMLVPDILTDPYGYSCSYVPIEDARGFLLDAIARLRSHAITSLNDKNAVLDGERTCLIDLRSQATVNGRHGTFLSLIPWLAYFVCDLGCRNVILLPLGPYGATRQKGKDGSLFSLADHFGVDRMYSDCLVPQLCAQEQYRAVVEAAAIAGVRVGAVQPLATAALDHPQFACDPSLTFWWAADPSEILYGPVLEEMSSSTVSISEGLPESIWKVRPPLPKGYAERFVEPPSRSSIRVVRREEGAYLVGKSLYRGRMVDVAIANAIPDVLPDMAEKYAWRDIALLNYWQTHIPCPAMLMGFVAHNARSSAERRMKSVMGERARRYGESLFWIDMARCLPPSVRNSAPRTTPTFASTKIFYEQITGNAPKWPNSPGTVIGEFLCEIAPKAATPSEFRSRLYRFLSATGLQGEQTNYLAGPGTHDSIAPEPRVAAMLFLLASILPGAQLLIVSGHERFSLKPINAEFGKSGMVAYDESRLGLFSCDPLSALSGLSASTLAEEYQLPPMARLLGMAAVLRDYARRCRNVSDSSFDTKGLNTHGVHAIRHWTVGLRPNGEWFKVLLRIDNSDSGMARIKWESDWEIVLRPMVSRGWITESDPTQDVSFAPVDFVVAGGRQLAEAWKVQPT